MPSCIRIVKAVFTKISKLDLLVYFGRNWGYLFKTFQNPFSCTYLDLVDMCGFKLSKSIKSSSIALPTDIHIVRTSESSHHHYTFSLLQEYVRKEKYDMFFQQYFSGTFKNNGELIFETAIALTDNRAPLYKTLFLFLVSEAFITLDARFYPTFSYQVQVIFSVSLL